jgi:post-segregation antitoxin (ccd killing protein)|tara:strand:+ start:24 stop:320 length:297 start_codon:yes stop_codon:yes gene_type:complete
VLTLKQNIVFPVAKVISVSVPDELYARWEESDLDISPSSLFQTALETQLGAKNQLVLYWSNRALDDEKKLNTIKKILSNDGQTMKRFQMFEKAITQDP